jgi:hypothetical protein
VRSSALVGSPFGCAKWLTALLDTREKPFSCQCGAAFTRRDLLTRHWRIANHGDNNDSIVQHQDTPSVHHNSPDAREVANGVVENAMLGLHDRHGRPELPAAAVNGVEAQIVIQDLQQGPYQDEGFEDFRDFVNFIDGVGLSAQWTPEYDVDWMRLEHYHQPTRNPSRELDPSHSSGPEDIGTPFSTWLPSAPAHDQVHLPSQLEDGKSSPVLAASHIGTNILTCLNRCPRKASQEWHIPCHG